MARRRARVQVKMMMRDTDRSFEDEWYLSVPTKHGEDDALCASCWKVMKTRVATTATAATASAAWGCLSTD